ncbi:dephospho-CoA kinase [Desulfobacterales bacterium HSG17]|nr:dephospho-CoA kinase [Desulfobacterales bacterium HSG17]
MSNSKQLWVLAGGNGAGKSTFYNLYLEKFGVNFVNADLIAREINPDNPEIVSYQAATIAAKIREDLLSQGITFCFETVFSHESKIDFIAKAKARGYQVILVYIHLVDSSLNEARVSQRVYKGGHSVPLEKIHNRIPRTMKHIRAALPLVDEARFLDNSSKENPYQQTAVVKNGDYTEFVSPLPEWAQEILSDYLHNS